MDTIDYLNSFGTFSIKKSMNAMPETEANIMVNTVVSSIRDIWYE